MITSEVMSKGRFLLAYCACSSSTLPASTHETPVCSSAARMPTTASMHQRPWMSSHSRKRWRPNTSAYGERELVDTFSFSGTTRPITRPATFLSRFWSSSSKSMRRYSAGFESPKGSKPRSPGSEPSSHDGRSAHGYQSASPLGCTKKPESTSGVYILDLPDERLPRPPFVFVTLPLAGAFFTVRPPKALEMVCIRAVVCMAY
mmetsp:Transcript_23269/g.75773  ORF Transcript_23269/g.75773 Transcript_23269/m.75773 type:complete len:203 (-) Transcript_23269:4-612(-)